MRRPIAFSLLLLILSAVTCAAPAQPPSPGPATAAGLPATATPPAAQRTAAISEITNDVESRVKDASAYAAARDGETILTGGGVRTGDDSRVRIDISDGSLVRIASQTEFHLLDFSPQLDDPVTRIELLEGQLWILVTKALGQGSFEVETPVGKAGVRGSLMSVAYDPATGRMTVTCLEGACRLTAANGSSVDLGAGEVSEIAGSSGAPSPPAPMTDLQLADWAANFPEASNALATATALPRPSPTPTASAPAPPTPLPAVAAPGANTSTAPGGNAPVAPGANTPAAPPPAADCSNLRSVSGTQTAAITFVNRSSLNVQVYWLSYEGKEILYNTLKPGQSQGVTVGALKG